MKKILLVLGAMFLMLSFAVMPASAEEKGVRGGKTTAKHGKCWERMEAYKEPDTGSYVRGDIPVCKAFEEVLNTTCEPPEKLQCNWTLPKGEKRFQKLKWETVDWREYWELIGPLSFSRTVPSPEVAERWESDKEKTRKDFEEGKITLSITTVDVDHNGIDELIMRMDYLPCNEISAASLFGVIGPPKHMDSFRGLFFAINKNSGPEIMYYDGRAFMFSLHRFERTAMIYEGLSPGERYSSQNVCQIKYIKGGS